MNCTSCAPAYVSSGENCVPKYSHGVYVNGLDKVVWIVGEIMLWEPAMNYCPEGMYLPSITELEQAYQYKSQIGTFNDNSVNNVFWSSTDREDNNLYAHNLFFATGARGTFVNGNGIKEHESFTGYNVMCFGNP